jgi:glutamine synthetase
MLLCAEYIWLDGTRPTKQLRSKTRILRLKEDKPIEISNFPEWGFDGSSTGQSPGHNSDLVLKPVRFINDPIRGGENCLVLCEVFRPDGTPHETNTRARLRQVLENGGKDLGAWVGFEQEYTLFQKGRPLNWPEQGFPRPQGPYYCSVGADRAFGRELVEAHTEACLDAGVMLFGTNGEVMPSQWEFQVGYRGFPDEEADPLTVSDHMWFARWMLHRIGEDFDIVASFDPKPVKGDWNGAGAHTNFSTNATRDPKTGWQAIQDFIHALSQNHEAHIGVYGHGLEDRLTGLHETCDINTFKAGERDRGASIRIPEPVLQNRCGYIEDRRPGANCDPYEVCTVLLSTYLDSRDRKSNPKEKSATTKRAMA